LFQMMNEPEVGGMRQEDYSKDWVMHMHTSHKLTRRAVYTLRHEDNGSSTNRNITEK